MQQPDESIPKYSKNPQLKSSVFGRFFFWWTTDIIRIGIKRPIEENDVYAPLDEHESKFLSHKYSKYWDDELQKQEPSMIRLFMRACGWNLLIIGQIVSNLETAGNIIRPICLGRLLTYFVPGQTDVSKEEAYYYALGIVLCSLFNSILFRSYNFYAFLKSMEFKLGLSALVYKKIMRLSKSTIYTGMNGQVLNFLSNDVGKFERMFCLLHYIIKGPIEIVVMGYIIYLEIGWSGLVGILFMCSFIPVQILCAKKSAFYRLKTAKRTDLRVRFMNEIIQGIQVIKMYTWESSFAKLIAKIRRKEMNVIQSTNYISAIFISLLAVTRISMFLSLLTYVLTGNVITARKVFIITSMYNTLNTNAVQKSPKALLKLSEGLISMLRIQEYLLRPEDKMKKIERDDDMSGKIGQHKSKQLLRKEILIGRMKNGTFTDFNDAIIQNQNLEKYPELPKPRRFISDVAKNEGIILDRASAVWTKNEPENGVFDIDLVVNRGELCAVIGPVGSGKSTLLNVIIGELDLDDGTLEVNGRLSYAGQEPWLFGGTVRQNIIFIEEFDEKRYLEVCRVCSLVRDFEIWPYGDKTIVGERGVSLSGGQRARINLARAIYRKADIYLLDDPLSAVDTHVGKHIFQDCIQEYLSDKCVILVTHQLQYLKHVQHTIHIENGRIIERGNFENVFQRTISSFSNLSSNGDLEIEDIARKKKTDASNEKEEPTIEKEKSKTGSVKFTVYKTYLSSVQSVFAVTLCIFLFTLCQIARSALDFFVAEWVNWEETLPNLNLSSTNSNSNITKDNTNGIFSIQSQLTDINTTHITPFENNNSEIRNQYVITYAVLAAIFFYSEIHRNFSFFSICYKASVNLHDKLFRGITRTAMDFFNNNPSGRILNRFAMDVGNVDSLLPIIFIESLQFIFEAGALVIVVSIVNPWLLLPSCVMIMLFYIIRVIYIKTTRCLYRIESTTRSPVFSHINATIQGISTLRTFNAQSVLHKEYNHCQDRNTAALYLICGTTRAFALWLDMICIAYIAFVTFSFLFIDTGSMGGYVGLAISQVIVLTGMCQYGIRQSAELENKMISVERIDEYAKLPSEPQLDSNVKQSVPKGWPEHGSIIFDKVNLRYSENGENVLRNLTFETKPGEKVGIVGRTGAGKSSIIQALFRLAYIDGKIEIDGINTKNLGLHDFRNKIAIIPQDPILFSGSMRDNLDPFERKTDDDIWNALDQVELKHVVSTLAGGLQTRVSDGGSNFSMGQRQLVCLARAILLNNKILVLDEATANVDPDTDKLIQRTIRTKFSECTVLTIAHRLHTIMDSDRVLVMDAGSAVEYGQPYELLQNSFGYLKNLVDNTGPSTAATLMRIAETHYLSRKAE